MIIAGVALSPGRQNCGWNHLSEPHKQVAWILLDYEPQPWEELVKKSQELKKAAAESASAAAEYGTHALKDGLERAQQLLNEAREQAGPVLHDAKVRSADFAARRLDDLEPHLKDALGRVTPAVDAAREKVTDDLLPRLQGVLHAAAEHPTIAEATRCGEAAIQALAGDLEPKRKKSRFKSFAKFLAIGAVVAGAVAAVRHFLAPKDDGWTAHEPSKAYVNNNDTFSNAAKFASATETVEEPDEVVVSAEEAQDQTDMTSEGAPPAGHVFVTEDEVDAEEAAPAAETVVSEGYGEGSYVGSTPPEGFNIKGNERSKKYHVEGTGGYERTIAEVWFNSEESAQAAGFTKAQR